VLWRIGVQVIRPLHWSVGILCTLIMSISVDYIFYSSDELRAIMEHQDPHGAPHISTFTYDSWDLKKTISFAWAFALGYYTPLHWLNFLGLPFVRGTAFFCFFGYLLLQALSPEFQYWMVQNIANLEELDYQAQPLYDKYGPDRLWIPRLYAIIFVTVLAFGYSAFVSHAQEWYSRYGAMSLYSYVLHYNILIMVFPYWDLYSILPHDNGRWIFVATVLPALLVISLGGILTRHLWWPIFEPLWVRIGFAGRWAAAFDKYKEGGVGVCWNYTVKELTANVCMGTPLKMHDFRVFTIWAVAFVAFFAALFELFTLQSAKWCANQACDDAMAWFRYEGGWTTFNRDATKDGFHGAMVPGGRSEAVLITTIFFLALAVEVVAQLAPTAFGQWVWMKAQHFLKKKGDEEVKRSGLASLLDAGPVPLS